MKKSIVIFDNSIAAGDSFDFTVNLPDDTSTNFSSISSIELVNALVPKVDGEFAVAIQLVGIDDEVSVTNNPELRTSFTAFFDNSLLNPGDFKPIINFHGQKMLFRPARPLGTKFRVQITTLDGQPVSSAMTGGEERVILMFKFYSSFL